MWIKFLIKAKTSLGFFQRTFKFFYQTKYNIIKAATIVYIFYFKISDGISIIDLE